MRASMAVTMSGSPRTGAEWSVPYMASSEPSGPCHSRMVVTKDAARSFSPSVSENRWAPLP